MDSKIDNLVALLCGNDSDIWIAKRLIKQLTEFRNWRSAEESFWNFHVKYKHLKEYCLHKYKEGGPSFGKVLS